MNTQNELARNATPKVIHPDEKDEVARAFGPSEAQTIRNAAANSYPASETAVSVAGSAKTAHESSFGNIRSWVKSPDVKINFDMSSSTHGGTAKSENNDKDEKRSKPHKEKEKEAKDDK